jgi:hypothetical protein
MTKAKYNFSETVQNDLDTAQAAAQDTGITTLAPNPYDVPEHFSFTRNGKLYRVDDANGRLIIHAKRPDDWFYHLQNVSEHDGFNVHAFTYGCTGCLAIMTSATISVAIIATLLRIIWRNL